MISEEYDLQLELAIAQIKKRNAKSVLIQMGEGLKPRAHDIQAALDKEFNKDTETLKVFFWLNSCYGKCDIPEFLNGKDNEIELLLQFGH